MTTENGIAHLRHYRRSVEVLTRRRDHLIETLTDLRLRGAETGSMSYMESEIAALSLAIPVLEAEWDSMARLRRRIQAEIPNKNNPG